jgi:tRNA(adenine34) deaminase
MENRIMDHHHFMTIALQHGKKALDAGEFPVGCVIADGKKVVATGARQGTRENRFNETDHAEIVALGRLAKLNPAPDRSGLILYSTLEPCLMCLGAILIHGISRIVYGCEDVMGGGAACDRSSLAPLYNRPEITITPGVMRAESLALLKVFFQSSEHAYLKDTLLARYILAQKS